MKKCFEFEAKGEAFTVEEMAAIFNKLVEEGCGKGEVWTYDWAVGAVSADEDGCDLRM